ncbi:hypothetical protein THF1C08_10004 [Vibrio jasicida]|uniref:Uncharacterized protein n=1 Tax=Vibrio jasicida TaxID=766224 RepID=A0AAU9QFE9_9VIBR|nr:hypothetical protein THF1C08_10004 [Vibrio jasicida]CAH1561866.1 hypothetical protein THF1A12_10004 [Vibrio jasicida]
MIEIICLNDLIEESLFIMQHNSFMAFKV